VIQLRPYQSRVLDELWEWFAAHGDGDPIIEACVGAGKSVLIAELCRRAIEQYADTRVLMLVHVKELIEQNLAKLLQVWPGAPVGVYSASVGSRQLGRAITYATIGSVARRAHQLGRVDLLLVDECHLVSPSESTMYRKLIDELRRYCPAMRVIGWTGTAFRGDGVWLTQHGLFSHVASRITMGELLQAGYLAPLVTAPTATRIDTHDVRVVAGEFVVNSLAAATDKAELVRSACAELVRLAAERRRWLVFAVTVAHAEHLAAELRDAHGIACAVVSAATPKAEREASIRAFRRGDLRALVNVAVLTTGFDVPELDCIALLRATRSPVLYVQICVDEQTEILTRTGWKRRGEIAVGEEVAGFDMGTSSAAWQPVLNVTDRQLAPGERMIEVQSPHLSLRVTDTHNLVIKARRAKSWQLQPAGESMTTRKGCAWMPVAAPMDVPDCELSDYEIRFIGWFLTDGTLSKHNMAVSISQRKSAKENHDIVDVLTGCGFRYGVNESQRKGQVFGRPAVLYEPLLRYSVSHGDARIDNGTGTRGWHRLAEWMDKDIPAAFDRLSRRQLLLMLDAMNKANGRKSSQTAWTERTMSIAVGMRERMADRVQALCVTRGIRCNVSRVNSGQFALLVSDKAVATIRGTTKHDDNNNAMLRESPVVAGERVWCVTTPMQTIFTRRQGKVVIVGNCGRGMRTAEGKTDCLWLDFTDTTETLGPVDQVRGRAKPKDRDGACHVAPSKTCDACGNPAPTAVLACPHCGHPFPEPERINHAVSASAAAVLATGPQWVSVSSVVYRHHSGRDGKPDTLRVDYWSGLRVAASEWVCLEHSGYARMKASRWWMERSEQAAPDTIDEALERRAELREPSRISIQQDGKYTRIAGYQWAQRKPQEAAA